MTVKELKERLDAYPDDMDVLVCEFREEAEEEILSPLNGLEVINDEYLRLYCHDDF